MQNDVISCMLSSVHFTQRLPSLCLRHSHTAARYVELYVQVTSPTVFSPFVFWIRGRHDDGNYQLLTLTLTLTLLKRTPLRRPLTSFELLILLVPLLPDDLQYVDPGVKPYSFTKYV